LRRYAGGAITVPVPVHPTIAAVELKVNVAGEHALQTLRALGLAAGDAKDRLIWFSEHLAGIEGRDALPLFHRTVIVRVRRKPRRDEGDVTIKLRGPRLELPERWAKPDKGAGWTFKIEGDWTGAQHTIAASLTTDFDHDADASGRAPLLAEVVVPRQLAFLHGSLAVPIDLAALRPLGPIRARTWQATDVGFAAAVAAEEWRAGALHILELSLRVDAADAEASQRAFGRFLRQRAVSVARLGQTKTALALHHLAGRR
jgi:hypothetical protein